MNALITVIVPVYNASKYIERCIKSLLSQSYQNIEIILVDDGSSDDSLLICERFANETPIVRVLHKDNGGASSARNYGLKNAKGDFITFCDIDDYVEDNWIESLAQLSGKADLGIVSHYLHEGTSVCKRELPNDVFCKKEFSKKCFDLLKNTQLGYLWSMIFDAKKLESIQFDETMTFQEDLDFILRYIERIDSIAMSSLCVYHYIYNPKKYCHSINGIDSIKKTLMNILKDDCLEYCIRYYNSCLMRILLTRNNIEEIKKIKSLIKRPFAYSQSIMDHALYISLLFPTRIAYFFIQAIIFVKHLKPKRNVSFLEIKRL